MNRKSHYTVARILHWVTACFVILNLLSGWRLGGLSLPTRETLVTLHAGVGTAIGLLMVFRWWWRRSHGLYAFPGWWRKRAVLLQLSFYPLLLIQVTTGVAQAAFIDYRVRVFGVIDYSALAPASEGLRHLFLTAHGLVGALLIVLTIVHAVKPVPAEESA